MNRTSFLILASALALLPAYGAELESASGWTLEDRHTGPFRHAISVISEGGELRYEAEFIMVNDGAEFDANLFRGGKSLGTFRCTLVGASDGYWFNVYDPPNGGLDASGPFAYPEGGEHGVFLDAAKAEYAKHDEDLNTAYQELMARLPESQKTDLRERQRAWIEARDYHAGFQSQAVEGKDKDTATYWEVAAYMTEDRVGFLRHVYANSEVSPNITGTYIDENGGMLSILERYDDWVFAISVVRGPTAHIGFIRGAAQKGGTGAAFKDWNQENFYDGKPAELRFSRDGALLQVEGENTQYYHGARAYFDGTYFKVTDLVHSFPDMTD